MRTTIRFLFVWVITMFGALLIFVVGVKAVNASDPPPWRQSLTCEEKDKKFRGVEYCTYDGGEAQAIVVDLGSSGVRLEYVIAAGIDCQDIAQAIGAPIDCTNEKQMNSVLTDKRLLDLITKLESKQCQDVNVPRWGPVHGGCADPDSPAYYPVMSLTGTVSRYPGVAAVVNTDYGAGTQGAPGEYRGHGPEGFTVVRGERLDGPANGDYDRQGSTDPNTNNAVRRPWLAIGANAPLHAEFDQFEQDTDDGGKPNWVYTGIGGGPWLIRDGEIEAQEIENCTNCEPHSCTSKQAQTAVGLSQDQRWLFLVVYEGQDAAGIARFMKDQLQVHEAIKFDGGGSSQLWYGGQARATGDGRLLSQYLAVIAEPGNGIDDGLPTFPPPTTSPGWWNGFVQKLQHWWEPIWQQVVDWWHNFRRDAGSQVQQEIDKMEDEAARQIEEKSQDMAEAIRKEAEKQTQSLVDDLLAQCSGPSAMLGFGIVTVYVRRRTRRR